MKKGKKTVRVSIVMDMVVSDEYLEKLQSNTLWLEVMNHCFRNHTRKMVSESIEVINNEGCL